MVKLLQFQGQLNLEGFLLVIPAVSVGNVPQLTIDLLITSLNLTKTATIWHPAIDSSVGPDPYKNDSSDICTACILYTNDKLKLAVLQLRSTINHKLTTKFFQDLKSLIYDQKVKNVVVLASSFDHEQQNVNNKKYYYVSNYDVGNLMEELNVKPQKVESNGKYCLHGSGFTVKLFETLSESLECLILIKYVSEGDNRADAVGFLQILSKCVGNLNAITLESIIYPSSWGCLFGGPPPIGLY